MAQEAAAVAADPGKFQESFRNRHQKEADRLKNEIVELVKQAKVLLHGQEPRSRLPPRPTYGKRADRENQLEATLEKANWYRHEIKKLRRDLESWDRVCGGPAIGSAAQDRDPMETYNLLVERRTELKRLQRNGQGLDRVAVAQRRAVAEQNDLSPEIEDRLRRAKDEFEQQKRLNIRLQADRQKVAALRKVAEQEVRAANSQLKSRAAQLQRPPRAPGPAKSPGGYGGAESKQMKQLRRDVDILSEAVRQDQRKHNAGERDDEAALDHTRSNVAKLQLEVSAHEAEIRRLQAELRGEVEDANGSTSGVNEILPPCAEGLPLFGAGARYLPLAPVTQSQELAAHPESLVEIAADIVAGRETLVETGPEPEVCGVETPSGPATACLVDAAEAYAAEADAQRPLLLDAAEAHALEAAEDDAEDFDDMAALVAPCLPASYCTDEAQIRDASASLAAFAEAEQFSEAVSAVPAREPDDAAALLLRAGASLAEASLSGVLPQRMDEMRREAETQETRDASAALRLRAGASLAEASLSGVLPQRMEEMQHEAGAQQTSVDSAALLLRAGASLAEASLSGVLPQRMEEMRLQEEAQQTRDQPIRAAALEEEEATAPPAQATPERAGVAEAAAVA